VGEQAGELVIIGDFLELWRFRLPDVLDEHWRLLDTLTEINFTYVLGNHDSDLKLTEIQEQAYHPIFDRIHQPFVRSIGDRDFKFMHGHEVDPFSGDCLKNWCKILNPLSSVLKFGDGACVLTNDTLVQLMLEVGENVLRMWRGVTRFTTKTMEQCHLFVPDGSLEYSRRGIRTRQMLARYHQDRKEGLYDVAIVGHTHKAGRCSQWYFNSGSWTGKKRNFLCILPDGAVEVCHWDKDKSVMDNTIIADIKGSLN